MTSIENELKEEQAKEKRRLNVYWLGRLMEAFVNEFSDNEALIVKVESKVFARWEKYKYIRDFYLAPIDIKRELEIEDLETKKRFDELVRALRDERERIEA